MQDFKIEDFCASRASRRIRGMRGNFFGEHELGEWHEFFGSRRMRGVFLNTNRANGTKGFLVGFRFLWLLWNVWLMRRVWMWGLDSDFDAGEEAARKGGTVDVA